MLQTLPIASPESRTLLPSLVRPVLRAPAPYLLLTTLVALMVAVTASVHALWWSLHIQPLPYANDKDLLELRIDLLDIDFQTGLAPRLARALEAQDPTFSGLIRFPDKALHVLDAGGQPIQLQAISADFTTTLGVAPALGRALDLDAQTTSGLPPLLLAHATWARHYGFDPAVVGRSVRYGDRQYEVVGVMPAVFGFPTSEVGAWTPYEASAAALAQDAMGAFGDLTVVGRLAEGATIESARAALTRVLRSDPAILRLDPDGTRGRADVRPWRERFGTAERSSLQRLLLSALLLCLLVAAGLSNFGADHALMRQRELATRVALGAGLSDLRRTLWAGLLPAVVPGLLIGLALVPIGIRLLQQQGLTPVDWPLLPALDLPTVLAACALALLLLLATGMVALHPFRGMANPGVSRRSLRGGLTRVQRALLIVQIGLALALTGSAGLLLRSATLLLDSELGFAPEGLTLTSVDLREVGGPDQQDALSQALLSELRSRPGVSTVALTDMPPFGGAEFLGNVRLDADDAPQQVGLPSVSTDYFATMGMTLMAGRSFQIGDVDVAIVDSVFRDRFLGGANAIGSRVWLEDGDGHQRSVEVIGIAPLVRQRSLDETERRPMLYQPMQHPGSSYFLLTRSNGVADLPGQIARTLYAQSNLAQLGVNQWMSAHIRQTLEARLALLRITGVFAAFCLLVAVAVMYAVLAVAIRRRHSELSLRLALGAPRHRVFALVLGDGLRLLLIGLPLGLVLGNLLALRLHDQLYGTSAHDPGIWLSSASVLVVSVLLATIAPAWTATRVAPAQALSSD